MKCLTISDINKIYTKHIKIGISSNTQGVSFLISSLIFLFFHSIDCDILQSFYLFRGSKSNAYWAYIFGICLSQRDFFTCYDKVVWERRRTKSVRNSHYHIFELHLIFRWTLSLDYKLGKCVALWFCWTLLLVEYTLTFLLFSQKWVGKWSLVILINLLLYVPSVTKMLPL